MSDAVRLIGVSSCAAYRDRREACERTWVPAVEASGSRVVFLIGDPNLPYESVLEGRTLLLRCGDGYLDLPEKTRRFVSWALRFTDSTEIFKCDDDTFLHAKRFAAYDVGGADYLGRPIEPYYASGGCGYFLSRRAAAIVASASSEDWAEDRMVGAVLRDSGIDLVAEPQFLNMNVESSAPLVQELGEGITLHLQRRPADDMVRMHDELLAIG